MNIDIDLELRLLFLMLATFLNAGMDFLQFQRDWTQKVNMLWHFLKRLQDLCLAIAIVGFSLVGLIMCMLVFWLGHDLFYHYVLKGIFNNKP